MAPWQSIIAPPSAIGKVVQVRCWGFAFGWGSLRGITEALKTNHVAISGDPVIWSCFQMQQVISILFIFWDCNFLAKNGDLAPTTLPSWQDCPVGPWNPDWGFGVWHSLRKIHQGRAPEITGIYGGTPKLRNTFPNFALSNEISFRQIVQLYEFSRPCWHLGFPRRSHSLTGSFWE